MSGILNALYTALREWRDVRKTLQSQEKQHFHRWVCRVHPELYAPYRDQPALFRQMCRDMAVRKSIPPVATWEEAERLIHECIKQLGHFPRENELQTLGLKMILAAIQQHGGFSAVRTRLGYGPATMEVLQSHANSLARILLTLQRKHPELSSDNLWTAIMKRWCEAELVAALQAFEGQGELVQFRALLVPTPEAPDEAAEAESLAPTEEQENTMRTPRSFFARPAAEVARELVGRTLVRTRRGKRLRVVITAVAAHEGGSSTSSRQGMNYAPGTIFVMPFRGRLFLNITTGSEGEASCVFIRAGIAEDGGKRVVLDGPAKLAAYLGATRTLDGQPLGANLWVEGEAVSPALVMQSHPGGADNCVGLFTIRSS